MRVPALQFSKVDDVVMTSSAMENLRAAAGRKIAGRFLQLTRFVKNPETLNQIEQLLAIGRFEDALGILDDQIRGLATLVGQQQIVAAQSTAAALTSALNVQVDFDAVNERAVTNLRNNQFRMIQEFTTKQRAATRRALLEGTVRGDNPRQQARNFVDSIGLTDRQQAAVGNYRRLLENNEAGALNRKLRDGRFDSKVTRAIDSGVPLGREDIDRMVSRYSERYVRYRSEVIARTESLRAVHEGTEEVYQQAIDDGRFTPTELIREWIPTEDDRTRDSHSGMRGQKVTHGIPFVTGDGNQIRYPGDTNAPAEETIQCRCVVTTRLT